MSQILFVGGGSLGHITPLVSVAKHMQTRGHTVHFACASRADETELLVSEDIPYSIAPRPKLSILLPFTFPISLFAALTLLGNIKPDIVLSSGGSLSIPICFMANVLGIPVVLFEADAVSGRANAFLQKFAQAICFGFHKDPSSITHRNAHITGHPLRPSITQGDPDKAYKLTDLPKDRPILLITGGSQGARDINLIIRDLLPELLKEFNIIHVTGRGKMCVSNPSPRYCAFEFLTDEFPHMLAYASLAVCRAGANTIAEHRANGLPSILVPLRSVAHDHQRENALTAAEEELFTYMEQDDLREQLIPILREMLKNKNSASESQKDPSAPSKIADILEQELAKRKGGS